MGTAMILSVAQSKKLFYLVNRHLELNHFYEMSSAKFFRADLNFKCLEDCGC